MPQQHATEVMQVAIPTQVCPTITKLADSARPQSSAPGNQQIPVNPKPLAPHDVMYSQVLDLHPKSSVVLLTVEVRWLKVLFTQLEHEALLFSSFLGEYNRPPYKPSVTKGAFSPAFKWQADKLGLVGLLWIEYINFSPVSALGH